MPRSLALVVFVGLGLSAQPAIAAQYARIKVDVNNYHLDNVGAKPDAFKQKGAPQYGQKGGGPGGKKPEPSAKRPPVWLELYLPIGAEAKQNGGNYFEITHPWNGGALVPMSDIIAVNQESVSTRFAAKKKLLEGNTNPDAVLDVANWALQHGLLAEFVDIMAQFEKDFANHPVTEAFREVRQKVLAKPSQDDPAAAALKYKGYQRLISPGGHFTLYTPLAESDRAVVKRFVALERAYQNFYYWFALKGKVLPQPNHRLFIVLEPTTKDFREKAAQFTDRPVTDAGFLAQGSNIAFLCVRPIDPVFAYLARNNESYYKVMSVTKKDVLEGKVAYQQLKSVDNLAKLGTLTLLEQGLDDSSARSTSTHQATQQLLVASGLLPRNVTTGDWLRYGVASFFEVSPRAFFNSTALPSNTNLVYFNYHRARSKLLAEPTRMHVLYRTVTDGYFHDAYAAVRLARKLDSARAVLEAEARLQIAQGTAWALTYHLMDKQPQRVLEYCAELSQLPRETDYGPAVLLGCFARACHWSVTSFSEPTKADLKDMDQFSKIWYDDMRAISLDIQGIEEMAFIDLATKFKDTPYKQVGKKTK